ncbi:MAG: hypothetical protein HON55_02990 [Legionellales bacterium]|jgi:uncharacterized protein HemX|nr:hypothetical protein [Legionellales bacterium]
MEKNSKSKDKKNFFYLISIVLIIVISLPISYCLIKISSLEGKINNQQHIQDQEQEKLGTSNHAIQKQVTDNNNKLRGIEGDLEKINYEVKSASPHSQDTKVIFEIQMAIYQANIFKDTTQTIYWLEKAYSSANNSKQAGAIKEKIELLKKHKNNSLEDSLTTLRDIANKIPELEFTVQRKEEQKKQDETIKTDSKASDYLVNFLNKYMIISHDNDENKRLWLSPTQKSILVQDILAMIYQAQWALLYQNNQIFNYAIDKSLALLTNINSAETQILAGKLNDIKTANSSQTVPEINDLLNIVIAKNGSDKKPLRAHKIQPQEAESDESITPQAPEISEEF